ncbi:MAG: hypothetical protein QOG54_2445 [Actinomycetota bacterium]|nr:hypothetical protein [Actinomycetota bacterium]
MALSLFFLGCSSGVPDGPTAKPCATPGAAPDVSQVPPDFPLDTFGTITKVKDDGAFLHANVITTKSIIEIYPPVARSLIDNGYETLSADNEGFEAEIYFRKGTKVAGAYVMREGPCDGLVTLRLAFGKQRFQQ